MCFHWKSTARQIRIEGSVELVDDATADRYFASRPRESQIGAWASDQSQPLASRAELERAFERSAEKFQDKTVTRPKFWSGYQLQPDMYEFWDKRPHRLHDRKHFTKTDGEWRFVLLYP